MFFVEQAAHFVQVILSDKGPLGDDDRIAHWSQAISSYTASSGESSSRNCSYAAARQSASSGSSASACFGTDPGEERLRPGLDIDHGDAIRAALYDEETVIVEKIGHRDGFYED